MNFTACVFLDVDLLVCICYRLSQNITRLKDLTSQRERERIESIKQKIGKLEMLSNEEVRKNTNLDLSAVPTNLNSQQESLT